MADLALWLAVACGCVAALMGSRTATVLLASAAFSRGLSIGGVPFDARGWLLIDLAAAAFICRANPTLADKVILALFPVAWGFYLVPDPHRYWGCFAVVLVQLFLTMPLTRLQGSLGTFTHGPRRLAHHGGG